MYHLLHSPCSMGRDSEAHVQSRSRGWSVAAVGLNPSILTAQPEWSAQPQDAQMGGVLGEPCHLLYLSTH